MAGSKSSFNRGANRFGDSKKSKQILAYIKLKIEKDFFCNVAFFNSDIANLALEIKFNFNLAEAISIWNTTKMDFHNISLSSRIEEIINDETVDNLDITELNLVFDDIRFVVYRIADFSILSEIDKLIKAFRENYLNYTQGLTDIPCEIHVPVIEEEVFTPNLTIQHSNNEANKSDYYKFWALHYEDTTDVLIFDLQNQSLIDGELIMIN